MVSHLFGGRAGNGEEAKSEVSPPGHNNNDGDVADDDDNAEGSEDEEDEEGEDEEGKEEDDSEEEAPTFIDMSEEQRSNVSSNIFKAFDSAFEQSKKALTGPSAVECDASGSLERTKTLVRENQEERAVCSICMEFIRARSPTWHCSGVGEGCFSLFHLQCIRSWAQSCQSNSKVEKLRELFPNMDVNWYCPQCRRSFLTADDILRDYLCFCGKRPEPPVDPWLPPHSCGEVCGRELALGCGHHCTLICHPGPCPPCPQSVDAHCYCGKDTQRRRCTMKEFSCNKPCGAILACREHRCEKECHNGPCPPCSKTFVHSCRCGKVSEERKCTDHNFQCEKECGKLLDCGRHTCEQVCHSGPCGPCALNGPRTCPCGREKVDLPCDKEAPSCGMTCDKVLGCGEHTCTMKCHSGPCEECRATVNKRCLCGKRSRAIKCTQPYRCDRPCNQEQSCGKHVCKNKCCEGGCSACTRVCGRLLNCGNHKCAATCHKGDCLQCPRTQSIPCACGTTVLEVLCGMERYIDPPKCRLKCKRPPPCHHTVEEMKPHKCHFGECPPCRVKCGRKQPNKDPLAKCNHICKKLCHDIVDVAKVLEYAKKKKKKKTEKAEQNDESATPPVVNAWGKNLPVASPKSVSISTEEEKKLIEEARLCPPCNAKVKRECIGKHKVYQVKCSSEVRFACGELCGRELACGMHKCQKECHDVDKEACETCTKGCEAPRPEGVDGHSCTHPCKLPCHTGACPPCQESIRLSCKCGQLPMRFPCSEYTSITAEQLLARRSCETPCHRKLPHCSHLCPELCHEEECPNATTCSKQVSVYCQCKRLKEQWPCFEVQQEQKELGLSWKRLRLLPCDDVCIEGLEKEALIRRQTSGASDDSGDIISAEELQRREEERQAALKARSERRRLKREARLQGDDESCMDRFRERCTSGLILKVAAVSIFTAAFATLFYLSFLQ